VPLEVDVGQVLLQVYLVVFMKPRI